MQKQLKAHLDDFRTLVDMEAKTSRFIKKDGKECLINAITALRLIKVSGGTYGVQLWRVVGVFTIT